MKKLLTALAAFVAVSANAETLNVAATPVPHAEILEFVTPALAEQGIELKVRVFTDYVQPNLQVQQGNLDANYFQTQPYLTEFNKSRKTSLVSVGGVHVEPFGAYSSKIKDLKDLPQGATVAIPNDVSNGGRALLLLEKSGLITLKEGVGTTATPKDIIENPKGIKLRELEAATLPRVLGQVDLALINTNYALEAKLKPTQDALIIESSDSPYANLLVTREDNTNNESVQKLLKALQTPEVKAFIEEKYQGAVVPAF